MRRVKLFKNYLTKDKTWVKVPDGEGNFIQYGVDYEEFETGAGNYTVGIIETDDGKVRSETIGYFEFIPKPKASNMKPNPKFKELGGV